MLSACTNNDQFTWENKYDDNGLLIKMIQPGGKNITFKYEMDDQNPDLVRKLIRKGKGEKAVIEYDRFGRRNSMTDNIGKVEYKYDLAGNLNAVTRAGFPTVYYEYNTLGLLTSIKTNNGYFANYEYDFLGRIASINSPAGKITYEYYNAQGTVVRNLPNGVWTQWLYGPDNRLQAIVHVDKNNHILHTYSYSYTPEGLINQIDEQTRVGKTTKNYSYDSEQRLIAYKSSDGENIEYQYDELGNRIAMTSNKGITEKATCDWAGRIETLNGKTLKYDKTGNLLTDNKGEIIYSYNVNNQLIRAGDVSYEYDGDGKLVKRNSTKFVSNLLSEIWQPLVAENNNSKTFYIWNGNTPVAQVIDGEVTFLLNDHLNSPRELMDSKAAIIVNQEYDPFGIPQNNNNAEQINPGFTGLFYDNTANVYLTATRAFLPKQARFLQMDPLKQVPSESQKLLSAFVYCGNDPVNYKDLIGTQSNASWLNIENDIGDIWYSQGYYERWKKYGYLPGYEYNVWHDINILKGNIKYDPESALVTEVNIPNYNQSDMNWRNLARVQPLPSLILGVLIAPLYNLAEYSGFYEIYTKNDLSGLENIIIHLDPSYNQNSKEIYQKYNKSTWPSVSDRFKNTLSNYSGLWIGIRESLNDKTPWYWKATGTYTTNDKYGNLKVGNIYGDYINDLIRKVAESPITQEVLDIINIFEVKNAWGSEIPSMPSNVGGVYLKGAGSALEGIQSLSGIALDETTGKIILLSEEDAEIDIPPLRLDDVVTIFRCVYDQGEAPYVSIDPDPENPRGPKMLSRHGKETENTYVGWILFETDRVMKAYSLGQDNVTNQLVKTDIAGYQEVLDAQFDIQPGKHTWERFWIVPAEVNKKQSQKKELTLYDIPLKVKTEKMILRNGKLETDPVGKSSKGAEMFSDWFTKNYEKIAGENLILPPEGSGFTEPVPIFKELQRMALITAIAEQLRDQGVPFPLWMRDYEVKKIPTPPTTPAVTIAREGINSTLTIYGGVALTTTDKSIEKVTVVPEATQILEQTQEEIQAAPLLETKTYSSENKKLTALALPGNNTKALTPCLLNEVDVALPLAGDEYLVFSRQYNSFYHPKNTLFNEIWTLNLPRLENPKRQIKTSDDKIIVEQNHYLITTPLNDYFEDHVSLYECDDDRISTTNRMCMLQNGDKCYFNEDGYLVGYRSGLLYRYIRNENNQIVNIEAWKGRNIIGAINLYYDIKNRLSTITGENRQLVKYTYAPDGLLKYVIKPDETILYSYTGENNLVESITINDKLYQKFTYNEKAQLIAVSGEFGEVENKMAQNGKKIEMTQLLKGDDNKQRKMVYDYAMRPLLQVDEDQSETSWDYSDPDKTKISYKSPEGYEYKVSRTNDNKSEVINYPDGNTVVSQFDSKGNLLSLNQNGDQIVSQDYYYDGKMRSSTYATFRIVPEYDKYGETSGITLEDADPEKASRNWQNTQYDENGNVAIIEDYSGYQQQNIYDTDGNLNRIVSNRGEMVLNRDNDNKVRSVQTSWGIGMENYFTPDGEIEIVQLLNGDAKASMKFENGLVKNVSDYNGNTTEYEYCADSISIGQVDKIRKDNLLIDYDYNEEGDLSDVSVNNTFKWNYVNGEKSNKITFSKVGKN